jgi:hypothetical protein
MCKKIFCAANVGKKARKQDDISCWVKASQILKEKNEYCGTTLLIFYLPKFAF